MKLSISSLVTWDAKQSAARAMFSVAQKEREVYRARIVDLDDDDAPTKLRRPLRPRSVETQIRP